MGGTDASFTVVALDDRVLLIDTGWGVGEPSSLVASLTPLPLTAANTHGHPDHFSGTGVFARSP